MVTFERMSSLIVITLNENRWISTADSAVIESLDPDQGSERLKKRTYFLISSSVYRLKEVVNLL